MKKLILVFVIVGALAAAALIALAVFKKEVKVATPKPTSDTLEFHSKNGYTVTYPKNWVADGGGKDGSIEFIREPTGKAFFSMRTHLDARIAKPAEMPLVHKDVEKFFSADPAYVVERLEWEKADKTVAENSYFAAGTYVEGGKRWRFKELGIFTKNGIVLTLRGMTLRDFAGEFGPILDKIIFSVVPDEKNDVAVNETQALYQVKMLPEVIKYEADLAKAGKKASFETQDDGDAWLIQVFEIVKNGNEPSHTATFGWYRVNKKTGVAENEL